MLALTLLVGGVAACSDDNGGDDTTAEDSGGSSGGESGGSSGGESGGNEAIQAYCDKVQELVDASAALQDDPTNADAQQTVTDLTTELGQQATDLAAEAPNFTAEDAEQFQGCQTDFSGIGG